MTLSAKKFFYVMITALILSVAGIVGAYYWGDSQLQSKATTISDLLADRDISQEKIIKLQKAKQDAAGIDNINQLLDTLLPPSKEQEKLIADVIYTATAEAGIPFGQVSSFSFSGSSEPDNLSGTTVSKDNPGVYEYPFTLQINDVSYTTLLKLLQEIETNGRIVQVANIQISPDASDPSVLSVSLNMKAYLKP